MKIKHEFIRVLLTYTHAAGLLFSRAIRGKPHTAVKNDEKGETSRRSRVVFIVRRIAFAIIITLDAIPRTDFHLKSKKDKYCGRLKITCPHYWLVDDQSGTREGDRCISRSGQSRSVSAAEDRARVSGKRANDTQLFSKKSRQGGAALR